MAVTFDIPGLCATKGSVVGVLSKRPGKSGKPKIVVKHDNIRLRAWSSMARKAAWVAGATRFRGGPVLISVDVVRPTPQSAHGSDAAMTRPDVDKYLRAVLDALTGIVYDDDSHVLGADIRKRYGAHAFTRITVEHADTSTLPELHVPTGISPAALRKPLTEGRGIEDTRNR